MDVSDEMMDKYIEVADNKFHDLADFTVKDAKKQDEHSYVTVVIKPSDVFSNLPTM